MFKIDRVENLIRENGLKKGAFCAMMGHGRTWIDDWKRGRSLPDENAVSQIAAALHTTPAYLMGETDDPSEGTKKEPATGEGDGPENQLIAFYGEVKSYLDDDDLNDIKIFMQMKADYKKRKMMENHDKG